MSPIVESGSSLGRLLHDSRATLGISLQEVAEHAGCSTAYVHKLEQDRVRTPSPRVLAGLARTLGIDYGLVMRTAGYDPPSQHDPDAAPAVARFSNAHIVQVLEALRADVAELKQDLDRLASRR
ncbi:MAG TPA: helix-turn-helix transcriptional regulator [Acidimicrobiales bacterium]|nr:helix-turn-helix transcriptional regulator [Acidimicrobiales bacterium]